MLIREKFDESKNMSTSLLKFEATDADHNSEFECEAFNSRVTGPGRIIRDRVVIKVNCKCICLVDHLLQ